jgi:pimeloyl-ACP methyl ester carboxylesterase
MSRHLTALLDNLGFNEPVVVAGQSYGGLICGVHATLMPKRLHSIVQIDPTVERFDPEIDKTAKSFGLVARLMAALSTLGIPVGAIAGKAPELPPDDADKLLRNAFSNAESLRSAIVEMDLLSKIRDVCALPSPTPRLVISAENAEKLTGLIKLILPRERPLAVLKLAQAQHKITADRGGNGSRWISLPHTHAGLVVTRGGASATAAEIIKYISTL